MPDSQRENIISVIVITYNQEKTIKRTLDSITMQKCHLPVEIVIGEDCSTDNTKAIIQEYIQETERNGSQKGFSFRLISNDTNKGIIDNYFDCLLACKGKYIADCAGDDYWTDDRKLEKALCVMEKDTSVTLVHTNWRFVDSTDGTTHDSGRQRFDAPVTNGKEMLEAIICQTDRPIIHLCTSLYRADAIMEAYHEDTFLFRNKDFGCEDLQIAFMLARKGNIAYIPDITLNYSVGHESVSNQASNQRQYRFVAQTTDLSCYLSKHYNIENDNTKDYFERRLFALCMFAFRAKDKLLRDETHRFQKAWAVAPSFRIRLVRFIMGNDATWSISLFVRKIVLLLKKHRF